MKKGVLILLGMFMMVSTVEAKKGNELPNRIGVNYSYSNAVNFIERGVEFYVFTNGEFDFNTNYNNTYYGTRRNSKINRDFRGRINRVGNVTINYDYRGNVSRIGNISMRYYRGKLTNVGRLNVRYDRFGDPLFYGNVRNNFYVDNGISINLNLGTVCDYNDSYFYRNDFRRNYSQIREDRNFFYYRANPNAKIGNRNKILKRRKQTPSISRRNNTIDTRKSNNMYRKPGSVNSKRKIISKRNNNYSRTVDTRKNNTPKKSTITRNKTQSKAPSRIKRKVDPKKSKTINRKRN